MRTPPDRIRNPTRTEEYVTRPANIRVREFIRMVERGEILEAMDEFYAEDVVMQESNGTTTVGKAANMERERAFFSSITGAVNKAESIVVDGDRVAIHWIFTFTGAGGNCVRMGQIADQTWRNDRIVHERFYYDSASLAA